MVGFVSGMKTFYGGFTLLEDSQKIKVGFPPIGEEENVKICCGIN